MKKSFIFSLRFVLGCTLLLALSHSVYAAYGDMLKEFNFGVTEVKRDNTRDRVYAASPSRNSVKVIDSNSLEVIASIFTGSAPVRMEISADSSRLYVANSGSNAQGIAVVNLNTLTVERHIATFSNPRDVAISADGRLFVILDREMRIYDEATGNQIGEEYDTHSTPRFGVYSGNIESSPDKQRIYYYISGLSPSGWSMLNVTTNPFTVVNSGTWGSNGGGLALSADGEFITFFSGSPLRGSQAGCR